MSSESCLVRRAEVFIGGFAWCERVERLDIAFAIEGVVGVFRATIVPARPDVDAELWLVVGDLPPAYLVSEAGDDWQEALGTYIEEMRRWVHAVRQGESLADVIPVNAPATLESAQALESRIGFLEQRLVNVDRTTAEGWQ